MASMSRCRCNTSSGSATSVRGDFGESIKRRRPVNDIIWSKVPNTVKLALRRDRHRAGHRPAAGLISAIFRYSFWDVLVTLTTTLAIGFPSFVLGLSSAVPLGVRWRRPARDRHRPTVVLRRQARHPARRSRWPRIDAAVLARLMRGTMLEVLRCRLCAHRAGEGPHRTHRAVCKHALRNAIVPIVTYIGVVVRHLARQAPSSPKPLQLGRTRAGRCRRHLRRGQSRRARHRHVLACSSSSCHQSLSSICSTAARSSDPVGLT